MCWSQVAAQGKAFIQLPVNRDHRSEQTLIHKASDMQKVYSEKPDQVLLLRDEQDDDRDHKSHLPVIFLLSTLLSLALICHIPLIRRSFVSQPEISLLRTEKPNLDQLWVCSDLLRRSASYDSALAPNNYESFLTAMYRNRSGLTLYGPKTSSSAHDSLFETISDTNLDQDRFMRYFRSLIRGQYDEEDLILALETPHSCELSHVTRAFFRSGSVCHQLRLSGVCPVVQMVVNTELFDSSHGSTRIRFLDADQKLFHPVNDRMPDEDHQSLAQLFPLSKISHFVQKVCLTHPAKRAQLEAYWPNICDVMQTSWKPDLTGLSQPLSHHSDDRSSFRRSIQMLRQYEAQNLQRVTLLAKSAHFSPSSLLTQNTSI